MAVALIGILVLQLVWMRNAVLVRNELFDSNVSEAMHKTAKRMETLNDMVWVKDIVGPAGPQAPHFTARRNGFGLRQFRARQNKMAADNHDKYDTIQRPKIENTIRIIARTSDTVGHNGKSDLIEIDSVITNWEDKIDQNISVMIDKTVKNLPPDTLHKTHQIELIRRFDAKADRLKHVAGKMIFEQWEMDKDHLPDTLTINRVLSEELQAHNIPIDYQMGVFTMNKGWIKNQTANEDLLLDTKYVTNLFPNEVFDRGERLAIYFPTRNAFIFKTLIITGSLSLIFCLFILVVFALSIYYILNQKKISEMKSDFINNMTHEFKTPLATISLAADTILNPKISGDNEKVAHFINIIKKENQRMNQQVESILQIARFERKDFEFSFKPVNLHHLIDKAIQNIELQVENKGGSISVEYLAQNPVVTADAAHVQNLLNNLLDNANKYSPAKPQIMVKTRNTDQGVYVTIADNGIGMNKQVQQKIFEKFYRETSGNVHNVKGFGLGLSYVKAVVDAHKGEIKVQSEPEKGSMFEIFFNFTLQSL
jgi:two-component system phosphate regulon sensor histidine kinase PhoR